MTSFYLVLEVPYFSTNESINGVGDGGAAGRRPG
jgi:hypothetical protein